MNIVTKRIMAAALAIMVAFTFMPGIIGQTAFAKSKVKKPAKVTGVKVISQTVSKTKKTASIVLRWKKAKNAKKYQVYTLNQKKTWNKFKVVKKTAKNKKKFTKKNLYKVKPLKGKNKGKFQVYKYAKKWKVAKVVKNKAKYTYKTVKNGKSVKKVVKYPVVTISKLVPGKVYKYKVRAVNGKKKGAFSKVAKYKAAVNGGSAEGGNNNNNEGGNNSNNEGGSNSNNGNNNNTKKFDVPDKITAENIESLDLVGNPDVSVIDTERTRKFLDQYYNDEYAQYTLETIGRPYIVKKGTLMLVALKALSIDKYYGKFIVVNKTKFNSQAYGLTTKYTLDKRPKIKTLVVGEYTWVDPQDYVWIDQEDAYADNGDMALPGGTLVPITVEARDNLFTGLVKYFYNDDKYNAELDKAVKSIFGLKTDHAYNYFTEEDVDGKIFENISWDNYFKEIFNLIKPNENETKEQWLKRLTLDKLDIFAI